MKVVGGRGCLWWYIYKEWLRRSIKLKTDAEIFCLYIPLRAFLWCLPSFRPCHKGALRSVHYLRQCHTTLLIRVMYLKVPTWRMLRPKLFLFYTVQKLKLLCVVWQCSSLLWHSKPKTFFTLCVVWFNAMLQCVWLKYAHQVLKLCVLYITMH